jgi:hypothetical protein
MRYSLSLFIICIISRVSFSPLLLHVEQSDIAFLGQTVRWDGDYVPQTLEIQK